MTIRLHDFDGEHSLTLDAGGLGADAAVAAAGHEPNGYFWEGLVRLKTAVESVIANPEAVRDIIARAETSGFEFDD
ncbi:Imm51 family immunity protein [Streptomyces chattanoogensis]